jgi:citrate synthase
MRVPQRFDMAIPGWLWPDNSFHGEESPSSHSSLEAADIENATGVFGILSNSIRLEILSSLYSQSDPIPYTDLRESTSVDDKGQFNYHLRQLKQFVQNQDGEYTLTERGEELVQHILSENQVILDE